MVVTTTHRPEAARTLTHLLDRLRGELNLYIYGPQRLTVHPRHLLESHLRRICYALRDELGVDEGSITMLLNAHTEYALRWEARHDSDPDTGRMYS